MEIWYWFIIIETQLYVFILEVGKVCLKIRNNSNL
jgi:hypothetical protein